MSVIIYHNARCSKSRETLKLLNENKLSPEIIEYLKTPLDVKTIEKLLDMLGMEPRDIMRKKEPDYKKAGLDNQKLSRKKLIEALAAHPSVLERPIVVINNKAVIGRPPENVLSII